MKAGRRVYSVIAGLAGLGVAISFLTNVLFFILIALSTVAVAAIVGFLKPLKYIGIELITLTTMLVGAVYGPVLGGLYGFTFLIAHLLIGRYYIGAYVSWLIPEYVGIGVLSGILGSNLIGMAGVIILVSLNLVNVLLTFITDSGRGGKHLPYAIGNTVINSLVFMQFFETIVMMIK